MGFQPAALAQNGALELELERRRRAGIVGERRPQMSHRLEQRIDVRTGRRRAHPAERYSQRIQAAAQSPSDSVKRLQRKTPCDGLSGRLERLACEQAH